jgi:hypothetical protein
MGLIEVNLGVDGKLNRLEETLSKPVKNVRSSGSQETFEEGIKKILWCCPFNTRPDLITKGRYMHTAWSGLAL